MSLRYAGKEAKNTERTLRAYSETLIAHSEKFRDTQRTLKEHSAKPNLTAGMYPCPLMCYRYFCHLHYQGVMLRARASKVAGSKKLSIAPNFTPCPFSPSCTLFTLSHPEQVSPI